MEHENVFKKLRHLAAKVEKETKHIETCVNMPAHMRPGARSAELILQELQCNVKTMTLQAQKDLKELKAQTSFRNLLENVEAVANLTRGRLDLLEENLQKYGYKQAVSHVDTNVRKPSSSDHVADKENREPDETDQDQPPQPPQTPKQASTCDAVKTQNDDNATRTPTLADFGISRATLDFLSKQNMASQRKVKMKPAGQSGPYVTPFKKMPVPRLPSETDAESPFDPYIVITPGLFGYGNKISIATPEHMQGSSYLNSPVPPVLQTPGLRRTWSEDDTTAYFNANSTTPHSQIRSNVNIHPTPTSYHANVTILNPQPKSMWKTDSTSDNTPTMPDLQYQPPKCPDDPQLMSITSKAELLTKSSCNNTPTEPQLMMAGVPEKLPARPVLLSQATGDSSRATMPTEPRLLSDELTANLSATPTPFKAFKNFHVEDEMPRTPELTFSYARYVDVGASLASSKDRGLQSSDTSSIEGSTSVLSTENETTTATIGVNVQPVTTEVNMQTNGCQKAGAIAFVSEEEFLQQSSFLQRLLPLTDVNAWVRKINRYLARKTDGQSARKTDGQSLLESEMSNIGMGPRAKAMLLLLVKLKRLSQARPNAAGDQAYFVI